MGVACVCGSGLDGAGDGVDGAKGSRSVATVVMGEVMMGKSDDGGNEDKASFCWRECACMCGLPRSLLLARQHLLHRQKVMGSHLGNVSPLSTGSNAAGQCPNWTASKRQQGQTT